MIRFLAAFALVLFVIPAPASAQTKAPAAAATQQAARVIEVIVDGGYSPARIEVAQGERVVLRFVRRDYSPCAAEVVFPSLGLQRELPVEQAVEIEIPTANAGEIDFHCGMKMLKGKVVVVAR